MQNGKTHSSSTGAVVSQTVVSHSVSVKDFNDIGVQTDTYQADVSTTQGTSSVCIFDWRHWQCGFYSLDILISNLNVSINA